MKNSWQHDTLMLNLFKKSQIVTCYANLSKSIKHHSDIISSNPPPIPIPYSIIMQWQALFLLTRNFIYPSKESKKHQTHIIKPKTQPKAKFIEKSAHVVSDERNEKKKVRNNSSMNVKRNLTKSLFIFIYIYVICLMVIRAIFMLIRRCREWREWTSRFKTTACPLI